MIDKFGSIAQRLARNPLGIIALFIVLVYGMAALVTTSSAIEQWHQLILIIFLVCFPILVLMVFYRLVTRHVEKLYGPTDYSNEVNFLEAIGRIRTERELSKKAEESAKEAIVIKTSLEGVIKPEATDTQLVSAQYGNRWNSPEMNEYKRVLAAVTSTNVRETPDKLMAAVEVLNFLEEVAIAVNRSLADERLAKNIFVNVVSDTWDRLEDFVKARRRSSSNEDLYKNIEELVYKWST